MEYKLGKVSKFYDSLHKTPKDYNIYGYPMVRVKDISTGLLDLSSCFNVSEDDYLEFSKKYKPQSGDIIITRVGTYGNIALVTDDTKFCLGQNTVILNVDQKMIDNKYLFYYLTSPKGQQQIESRVTGSTQKTISLKSLKEINIIRHDYYKEKQIGNLLYKIDNKINNNRQIAANLEELSQTLFKRWFVDFEFPNENGNPYKSSGGEMIDSELGNIPRDWEVNELGNYVDITKGLSYKGAFLDKQHERSDSFPLLSISNFNFISGFKSNKTKYYFGDYKERHLVNPGDILIAATDLTQDRKILGAPAIVPNLNKTMIFSLDVFKITETTIPKYVLYFLLQSAKYREFVEGSATGTTVIRIAKNVILKVPIVINKDISLKFDNLIKPYMEKIEHLSHENQKLTQLRDTLLPKLMSGEIEIPDDIEVNEDELSI
ncbi:restriction endonuclease subunit S [Staphylococcus haemolyticus]|uniref:restriction endonuclease subunit S n=1 Tax=Staphylococcus haemolyticus TaxID=1283 RepID=UPI0029019A88|nr:restriction endonuclease subunit S [Staphylococcus haemolyticus]MDU0450026.1 restriction endonuclease subunit S [Staphylococcus haemolyticus]MDU0491413.1 restriction endonuclease subunit S [Staphylococcus haemolyticus]